MCVLIYINKCDMKHFYNAFNKLKVDDSTHVNMLIVHKIWKNSQTIQV
jgi:hypothetical protein